MLMIQTEMDRKTEVSQDQMGAKPDSKNETHSLELDRKWESDISDANLLPNKRWSSFFSNVWNSPDLAKI